MVVVVVVVGWRVVVVGVSGCVVVVVLVLVVVVVLIVVGSGVDVGSGAVVVGSGVDFDGTVVVGSIELVVVDSVAAVLSVTGSYVVVLMHPFCDDKIGNTYACNKK